MTDYGCDGKSVTSAVDRVFVMCRHVFYNESWIDQGAPDSPPNRQVNNTGDRPDQYTTSLIGNTTLRWIRSVVEAGPDHRPFFAWVGPHAPHLPSTPAAWYLENPVGALPVVKEPNYGLLGADKHAFYPREPVIGPTQAASIQVEYSKRLRSLLSVDDLVQGLREYLVAAGEWNNTFVVLTSDHGYTLGGFRVNSHKMQVYDHVTRVPFLVRGPGIPAGVEVDIPASMVDVGPTLLALAGGNSTPDDAMDGISFAQQLTGAAAPVTWPRDAVLIEYQSLSGGPHSAFSCSSVGYADSYDNAVRRSGHADCVSAYGYRDEALPPLPHSVSDGPNNTYSALRYTRGSEYGPLLYAEFADVSNPEAWDFAPATINFRELYNMTADPYMLRNLIDTAPKELTAELSARLHRAIACHGAAQCTASLRDDGPPGGK